MIRSFISCRPVAWPGLVSSGLMLVGWFFTAGLVLAQDDAKATKVFVYEVGEQSFSNALQALGTLRANEATTISASVTETVTAIHFDDGQRVKKGDVLVEMASGEERALLDAAQHALIEAEQQYLRVQSLVKSQLATQAVLDERKLAYDSARSRLEATRSRLRDLLIVAPFDGVVGLRNISLGALVRPGDVITTLDDDSVMKLDMSVPSMYLPHLKIGMSIAGKAHALGDKPFVGEIASIGSRIDPVTRSVQVRAVIPNPERILKPGLLMIVELEEPPRNIVVVPEKALIQSAAQSYVYVVDDEQRPATARRRDVTTGDRKPGVIEIVDGLSVGEKIVTHGHLKLKDGSAVEVTAFDSGSDRLNTLLKNTNNVPNKVVNSGN